MLQPTPPREAASENGAEPSPGSSRQTTRGDARRLLKASADDVAFLANRVQRLEREAEVSQHRLRLTLGKAAQSDEARARHAAEAARRAEMRETILQTQLRERALLQLERQRGRDARLSASSAVALHRRERVLSVRREEMALALRARCARETDAERRRTQHAAIRAAESLWRSVDRGAAAAEAASLAYAAEAEQMMAQRDQNVETAAALVSREAALLHRLARMRQENASALSQRGVEALGKTGTSDAASCGGTTTLPAIPHPPSARRRE